MTTFTNVRRFALSISKKCGLGIYFISVLHCVCEYFGGFIVCIGPSMEPTIYENNLVFSENFSARMKKLDKGDIVISKNPENPKQLICKRIIALPGDKVRSGFFTQIIPKGHVWLEGDNRFNSSDSRNFGPIPEGLIRGRVVFRIWPLSNIKWLSGKYPQSN